MKFFIICAVFLISSCKAGYYEYQPWNSATKGLTFNCKHFKDESSEVNVNVNCDLNDICNTIREHSDVLAVDILYTGSSTFNSAFNTIIDCLPPSIEKLELSGSYIGKPKASAFGKLTNLHRLKLTNTSLIINDSNPFEQLQKLQDLDISNNDEKNIDFGVLSTTLNKLTKLSVAHCQISNVLQVTDHLGASLETLVLSGNPIGRLNADSFKNLSNLKNIYLDNVGISALDIDTFKHQPLIERFDVSYNNLTELDLQLVPISLEFFLADRNDLKEIKNFDEDSFPLVQAIAIAGNQFSCDYLVKLVTDWPALTFLSNPAIQKHGDDCESRFKTLKKPK